jgi:hypothetical protein
MSETGSAAIALPAKSRELLRELIQQREHVDALLEAALAGVRSALDVPDGWQLVSLDAGFTPPAPQQGAAQQTA